MLPLGPALLAAWLNPKRPAWSWARPSELELTPQEAARLPAPVIWLDARPEAEFGVRHVPGALCLNEEHWEELLPAFMSAWGPDTHVVVYCDSRRCDASREVAERLRRELKLDRVYVLQGGWKAWLEAQP